MKTLRFPLMLAFFLLSMVVVAPSAEAQKIPQWNKSQEYKRLVNYVNYLGTQKNTPVSETRKGKYELQLTQRRIAAVTKSTHLTERRNTRARNNFNKRNKRQARSLLRKQKQQLKNVNRNFARKQKNLLVQLQGDLEKVDRTFAATLNPLNKRMAKLRKQYMRSGPVKRLAIKNKIINTQKKIDEAQREKQVAVNLVEDKYADKGKNLQKKQKQTVKRVKRQTKQNIRSAKLQSRALLNRAIQASQAEHRSEVNRATTLFKKGERFIAVMPPLPVTSPTE